MSKIDEMQAALLRVAAKQFVKGGLELGTKYAELYAAGLGEPGTENYEQERAKADLIMMGKEMMEVFANHLDTIIDVIAPPVKDQKKK